MITYSETLIIIPCLKERENLSGLLPEIFKLLPGISVLVADDNSRDGTEELVKKLKKEFPSLHLLVRQTDKGYGRSVLDGMSWARERGFRKVITMDADFSHDHRELPAMIKKLESSDVIIGSRYIEGGGIVNWGLHRRLLSRFANWYVKFILGLSFHDSTTGFIGYRINAVKKIIEYKPRSEGYSFIVECKYVLYQELFSVSEHPITFQERREGQSKMSWGVIWESVWLPWRLKFSKK